ncbi:MAG: hypothetical protein D6722_01630 [Bacteroidetes bacterium]|nr:MAG: hypothetical protein D6722_01630 [Bacteroidota bacterium]
MADYVIGEMARARGGAGKAFATQHNMVLPHVPIIPPPTDRQASDFFPTLCELGRVPLPEGLSLDGISFLAPLLGQGAGRREWVTGAIGQEQAIFDGQWRLLMPSGQLVDCRALPSALSSTE